MNRKFSKDEAQRIFSLAAERQQAKQKEDTNQLTMQDLEEAGAAAGIDPAFIRAAASDLLRPSRATEERKFFGFPVELRESHVLTLDFNEENWKKSVDIFAEVYNKPGYSRDVGTTKRWSSEKTENQLPTHIIAEKDEDGTRFTIDQKTWPMTLGFGIGAAITFFMGLIFFVLLFLNPTEGDLIIPASIMTGIGFLLGLIGAFTVKVMSKQEKQRFAEVFEQLNLLADLNLDKQVQDKQVPVDASQRVDVTEPQINLDESVAQPEEGIRLTSKPRARE